MGTIAAIDRLHASVSPKITAAFFFAGFILALFAMIGVRHGLSRVVAGSSGGASVLLLSFSITHRLSFKPQVPVLPPRVFFHRTGHMPTAVIREYLFPCLGDSGLVNLFFTSRFWRGVAQAALDSRYRVAWGGPLQGTREEIVGKLAGDWAWLLSHRAICRYPSPGLYRQREAISVDEDGALALLLIENKVNFVINLYLGDALIRQQKYPIPLNYPYNLEFAGGHIRCSQRRVITALDSTVELWNRDRRILETFNVELPIEYHFTGTTLLSVADNAINHWETPHRKVILPGYVFRKICHIYRDRYILMGQRIGTEDLLVLAYDKVAGTVTELANIESIIKSNFLTGLMDSDRTRIGIKIHADGSHLFLQIYHLIFIMNLNEAHPQFGAPIALRRDLSNPAELSRPLWEVRGGYEALAVRGNWIAYVHGYFGQSLFLYNWRSGVTCEAINLTFNALKVKFIEQGIAIISHVEDPLSDRPRAPYFQLLTLKFRA